MLLLPVFMATSLFGYSSKNNNKEQLQKQYPEKSLKLVYKNESSFNSERPYLYHIPDNCFGLNPTLVSKQINNAGEYEVIVKYSWAYSKAEWKKYLKFYRHCVNIKKVEEQ